MAVFAILLSPRRLSATELFDLSIVEIAGRAGHQGLLPIQALPIKGVTAIARARLIGAAANVRLLVRDESGTVLGDVPMLIPPASQAPAGSLFAEFLVPQVPFTLNVAGVDSSGRPFELPGRGSTAIAPQTLDIRLFPATRELSPSLPVLIAVQVANHGATGEIGVSLSSDVGGGIQPGGARVHLAARASTVIGFRFSPSSTVSAPAMLTVTATAARVTEPTSRNRASARLLLSPTPQSPLRAWSKGEESLEDGAAQPTVIWVCNANVDARTLLLAYDQVPVGVEVVQADDDHNRDKDEVGSGSEARACQAPSLLRVTFDTQALVAHVANGVFPVRTHDRKSRARLPITAYATDGSRMIGDVSVLLPVGRSERSESESRHGE